MYFTYNIFVTFLIRWYNICQVNKTMIEVLVCMFGTLMSTEEAVQMLAYCEITAQQAKVGQLTCTSCTEFHLLSRFLSSAFRRKSLNSGDLCRTNIKHSACRPKTRVHVPVNSQLQSKSGSHLKSALIEENHNYVPLLWPTKSLINLLNRLPHIMAAQTRPYLCRVTPRR